MSDAKKKREEEEKAQKDKINAALAAYEERQKSKAPSAVSDITKRIQAESEAMQKVSTPSWGEGSLRNTLDETRESRVRLADLQKELESYNSFLDKDVYDKAIGYVTQMRSGYDSVIEQAKGRSEYDSEDDYTAKMEIAKKQEADYQAKLDYDLEAGKSKLDELESTYDEAMKIVDAINERTRLLKQGYTRAGYGKANVEDVIAKDSVILELQEQLSQYGDVDALGKELKEKKAYHTLAGRAQKAVELASVSDPNAENYDANYEMYSGVNQSYANDSVYKYINDINNFRAEESAYWLKHGTITTDTGMVYPATKPAYMENAYKHMTDDEIGLYNYYYELDKQNGTNTRLEYLDSIQETLNYRAAEEMFAPMKDKEFEEMLFGIAAGLDQFETGIENLFSNEDYIPASATQMASGMVREDLADNGFKLPDWLGGASIGQVAYDSITTTSNMLPSIMVSMIPVVGQAAGAVTLGASAAGHAKAEMLNLGYTKSQANLYGVMVGASEAGLQYLLGGISKLGGKASKGLTELALSKIDNTLARAAITLGSSMASEGLEEALQTVIEPWLKSLATGVDFEAANIDEVLYSGLLGALSSLGLEGASTAANVAATYAQQIEQRNEHGQAIIDNGGVDYLKEFAREVAGATQGKDSKKLASLAEKVEKKATDKNAGKLSAKMEDTIASQNRTDIQKALVEKGLSSKDAKRVSEYLLSTETLTAKQKAEIEGNENIKAVAKELLADPKSTINERGRNLTGARLGVDTKNAKVKATESGELSLRNDVDVTDKVSEAGKTTLASTGETITIDKSKPIAKIEYVDGERVVYYNTDHGTVEASNVKYASEAEGLLHEAFVDMNPSFANAVIKNYDGSVPVQTYINGMREGIVLYGMHNFQAVGKDISKNTYLADLSERDQNFALKLGRAYAKADAKSANADLHRAIANAAEKAKASEGASTKTTQNKAKKGKVSFEDGAKAETHKQHRKIVSLAKVLASAIGIDIVFYDSRITAKEDGRGANGFYDEDTDTIYLDLQNAKDDAKTIAYTLSHELVHFIKKWSPAKFNTFAEFLMEQYASHGVSASTLLKNKMAELNTTDVDKAYEEMICDACETMLLDSNAVVKLMELRKSDLELFEKIRLHILKILNDIREAYKKLGYQPTSDEAKALLGMKDVLEKFYSLFEEAAVDATKTYQATENSNNKDGKIHYSLKVKRRNGTETIVNPYEITDEKVLEFMLMSRRGQLENYTYFPVSPNTPKTIIATLKNAGIDIEDRPLAMQADKARQSQINAKPIRKHGFTIRYHAMSAEKILEVVNNLDEATTIIHQRNRTTTKDGQKIDLPDNFAVFVTLDDGKEYVAIIEFDAEIKSEYILEDGNGDKYHTTVTIFEPDVERGGEPFDYIEYLLRGDNQELDIMKENPDSEAAYRQTEATTSEKEFSDNSIAHPNDTVKKQLKKTSAFYETEKGKMIASAMDMATCKAMIERTYYLVNPNQYGDTHYRNAEEWLADVGASEVALYVDNEYIIQEKYLNKIPALIDGDVYSEEIIEAYQDGALIGGNNKKKANRLDVKQGYNVKDNRFYSPQIVENAKALYDVATQRINKANKNEVIEARAKILIFAHNKGAVETLGITQSELNQKLRSWANYSTFARETSQKINNGVALSNMWTGIENSSYLYNATVSEEDFSSLVGEIIGNSSEYERRYIANTMLALDTHIDYTGIKFEFGVRNFERGSVLGQYDDSSRTIKIKQGSGQNTVSHEIGHAIDHQWRRDVYNWSGIEPRGYNSGLSEGLINFNLLTDADPEVKQWVENFFAFVDNISDSSQVTSEYLQSKNEVFARFTAKFVEWTMEIATGRKGYYGQSYYSDKFTGAQFIEFVKILQEKAKLDSKYQKSTPKSSIKKQAKKSSENGELSLQNLTANELYAELISKREELSQASNEQDELEDSEEYQTLTKALVDSGVSPDAVANYNAWNEKTGYSKLYERVKLLAKEARDIAALYDKAISDKYAREEQEAIAKSGLSEAEYFRKQAVKEFGYTPYLYDAGYLLPNGRMLNFSGEKGQHYGTRGQDHRAIGIIYSNIQGSEAMLKFMEQGNIRVMAETPGIDLSATSEPTKEQYDTISRFVTQSKNKGYFCVDLTDAKGNVIGSLEYENSFSPVRVINDIKNYFKTGEIREQSSVAMFHYQKKKASNRTILANALESVAQNDIERNKLKQYKDKISLIEAEQAKLAELNGKIKELSFAKGTRDTEGIRKLQFEAKQTANRINTYDRQLLTLEATTALKGVLDREKAMAYKKAEQKGKEALAKARENATKTQRELLTRYQESRKKGVEGRKKTEMRYKIKGVVNDLNNYLLKGTKEKHVPIGLQKVVAEALDAVNMDTVGAEERIAKKREEMRIAASKGNLEKVKQLAKEIDHIEEMGGNMSAKLERLKTAYDSIINSEDPLIANSHDEVISNTIAQVIEVIGDTSLRDMNLYQLEAVYKMYRMLLTSVRGANKAFKAAKNEEISTLANRIIEDLVNQKKRVPYSKEAMDAINQFNWNNLKPIYAFERIGSNTFTDIYNNVRAGEDTWARDMVEAQAFLEEQKKKYNYKSFDFGKKYEFTSSNGHKFSLNLEQIMSLYAYSKRGEQAKHHLRNGGFQFDKLTEVDVKDENGKRTKKYLLKDTTAYKISDELLAEIIGVLDQVEGARGFADSMQEYLSSVMGEKGNEVSLAMYDVKLFGEKNYFPLKVSEDFLARAREQAQGDVKIKNKGFTKALVEKAAKTIVLTPFMDVWAGHVNEMSMYHAFTLPLEDFYRVFNYSTPAVEGMDTIGVVSALSGAHREGAVQYIDQLLKDINGGARSDPRESTAKKLMANFKKASVMLSLSVVIQQPSAIVRATALVNARYFVGKKVSKGKANVIWEEVKKYAPVAIIKDMGHFDVGMGKGSADWLKGNKTWKDRVDDIASWAPSKADQLTWISIWNAVKRETLHTHKNLKPNSEEFLQAVGERFTEVITKTQVYDSTLSRSGNMRSKSAYMNMLTSFLAEPTTSINMLGDALRKGKKGNVKYMLKAMGAVYGSVLLNSALVSLVYAMRDDDEDETYLEKYLSRFTSEIIDGVNPLTYIPFVKDIWSAAQGFDIERADMTLISAVLDSMQQFIKVLSKDTSEMDEEELDEHNKAINESILSIIDTAASLVGLPVKNVRRDFDGIVNAIRTISKDTTERDTSWGSLGDAIGEEAKNTIPVWGWLPDEKKEDKLYDAIIKGDDAYVSRFENSYGEKYTSAIRKALKRNDPRIKEAALADINGDIAEKGNIIDEIVSEGNFDENDILSAINSEIDNMTEDDDASETTASKDISRYDIDDYYISVGKGDTKTANIVKEEIIDTKIANGDSKDEAEKSFASDFRSYVGKLYKNSEISRSKAEQMLQKYGDYDADDTYWKLREWDYKIKYGEDAEYSTYTTFYDAVKTGKNLKAVIKEYTDHGVDAETLAKQITTYYKPLYKAMSRPERASIKGYLLNAYVVLGYNRSKKSKDIDKWLED